MTSPQIDNITKDELYVSVGSDQLYVKRYRHQNAQEAILMIHGSVESGRIFYSNSDKGIAPYLAQKGFDVFVADFRGRGKSTPPVSSKSKNRQIDAIEEEIPALLNRIKQEYDAKVNIHIVAHSWGGVWMLAHLARHPELTIKSMVYLAVKRSISIKSFKKFFEVDLVWKWISGLITNIVGYFPAKEMKIGDENESKGVYQDCKSWVYSLDKWVDPTDGFDYLKAFEKRSDLPPTLYLTGKKEYYLGHQQDVKRLMKEVNNTKDQFIYLSKDNGYALDYNHINICTAKEAIEDHFPIINLWLKQQKLAQ
ncbi:alpha/beta fold hydrolase [Flammeovirga sp. SubArs3]|uniref:alpha/beta fold hydrolase n=1 Tax=Flammeovirga sp. SubArs3 TaxID=2995316 RepID=UPI00248C2A95|nr:alpha/beta fold hydrolase [Flammeovirga sp. SubArs3]